MPPWFYIPFGDLENEQTVELPRGESHHAARVLRLKPGSEVCCFDGRGTWRSGAIFELSKTRVRVRFTAEPQKQPTPAAYASLAFSLCKGQKSETIIQKAVELGVSEIQPLLTHHSVVKLSAEKREEKQEHWNEVIVTACKQCEQPLLPIIQPIKSLEDLMAEESDFFRLALVERSDRGSLLDCLLDFENEIDEPAQVQLLVGPEGGWSDDERDLLLNSEHIKPVSIGRNILRAETACLAALSQVMGVFSE
jgi:16S rRNA (uracil1498-N3)-methyltransferase